jgi:hypothetical protein
VTPLSLSAEISTDSLASVDPTAWYEYTCGACSALVETRDTALAKVGACGDCAAKSLPAVIGPTSAIRMGYAFCCSLCRHSVKGRVPWANRSVLLSRVRLKVCLACLATTHRWEQEAAELAKPAWAQDDVFSPEYPAALMLEHRQGVEEVRSDNPVTSDLVGDSPEQYVCRECGSAFTVRVAYRSSPPPDYCVTCRANGASVSLHALRGGAVNPR